MLRKPITITVRDYKSVLSSKISLYKNDALDLIFTIQEFGIVAQEGKATSRMVSLIALSAKLLVETPAGLDSVESAKVEECGDILFRLTPEHTKYVGISKMQIVLYDEDGCKITIPEFSFEVKPSINEEWDGEDSSYPDILLDDEGNIIVLEDTETAIFK